ncbi:hypothetical protein GCM10017767_30920 [Halomonas urumqiensis]|nr:hypothetical protein GCM10017767_30920 [Halomonas urumqiensis]
MAIATLRTDLIGKTRKIIESHKAFEMLGMGRKLVRLDPAGKS